MLFLLLTRGQQARTIMSAHLADSNREKADTDDSIASAIGNLRELDEAFLSTMSQGGAHRFHEAKSVLRCTELPVLAQLARWRRKTHDLFANSFAQTYLLSSEWAGLRGVTLLQLHPGDAEKHMTMQFLVLRQAIKRTTSALV